jgi:hypothetical protein
MGNLRTITNDYRDCQVWDLDSSERGRGPFAVCQLGIAPGDDSARERLFVLRRDGLWVDLNYYLSLNQPAALDEAVFDTTQAIIELLRGLDAKARVANAEVSEAGLRAWSDRNPSVQPGLPGLRAWVEGYRARHPREW